MKANKTLVKITRWLAGIAALLLFLFWGAFFVEHLQEWFLGESRASLPLSVWVGQLLHLVMLLGLAMTIFCPVTGAIVTIVGTAAFFSYIEMKAFPFVALLNLFPVLLALLYGVLKYIETGRQKNG